MKSCSLLWLVGVCVASIAPAAAEFIKTGDETVDGWAIRSYNNTDKNNAKWCRITSPPDSSISMVFGFYQKSPPDPRIVNAWIGFYNPSWAIGPNSAGEATVEINRQSRTLRFVRLADTEMQSDLPADYQSNEWMSGLFAKQPSTARLPNGQVINISALTPEAADAAKKCVGQLIPTGPSSDPFGPPRR